MALICPNCQARNRSIAKFCIECITSLPTGCADTDFAPTLLATPRTSYLDRALALKAHWSKASNPRMDIVAAMSSGRAETSTKSRSQERSTFINGDGEQS